RIVKARHRLTVAGQPFELVAHREPLLAHRLRQLEVVVCPCRQLGDEPFVKCWRSAINSFTLSSITLYSSYALRALAGVQSASAPSSGTFSHAIVAATAASTDAFFMRLRSASVYCCLRPWAFMYLSVERL